MRTTFAIAATLCLSVSAAAQYNRFEVYPLFPDNGTPGLTATSFTDRGPLQMAAGDLLQEIRPDAHMGIGDDGTACTIRQAIMVLQDWNAATPEQFQLVYRRPATTPPGPDGTAAGIIAQSTPLTTPTGAGVMAWQFTVTLTANLPLPCEPGYYQGVHLLAAPAYPADGLDLHGAFYQGGAAGDNPRAGAPNLAWAVDTTTFLARARTAQSARLSLTQITPMLRMGGINPSNVRQPANTSNYGAGGIYPDVSGNPRSDGLDARVFSVANANGLVIMLMAYQPGLPGGLTFTGIAGHLWINPNLFLLGSGVVSATGQAVVPIAPAGSIPVSLVGGFLTFQGVVIDSTFTNLAFSNMARVNF